MYDVLSFNSVISVCRFLKIETFSLVLPACFGITFITLLCGMGVKFCTRDCHLFFIPDSFVQSSLASRKRCLNNGPRALLDITQ